MNDATYIGTLAGTISALCAVVAFLYKTVLSAKDALIADKDAQIQEKIKENAELRAINTTLYNRVDTALDTLGEAINLAEHGSITPTRRTQRTQR